MKLKTFAIIVITLVLTLFYTGSTIHYFEDNDRRHTMLKDTILNTMTDLDFTLSKNNCSEISSHTVLLKRKLATNKYLSAITVYEKNMPIMSTNHKMTTKPIVSPTNISDKNIEEVHNLKSVITCYDDWTKKEYELIFTLDRKKVKSFFNNNFVDYFLVFILYPGILFILIGYMFSKYIFEPLQKLKQYTTEAGVLIPSGFDIKELEELRFSTVDAFERLKEERHEMFKLSRIDALTNIGNRYHLNEQIGKLIADRSRRKQEFYLLFIDIDNFKSINDSLGHDIGDEVLIKVADILRNLLHMDDDIARIGGDEFIILVNSISTDEKLERVIETIAENINSNIIVDSNRLNLTASIGIAKYPEDGASLASLLQRGDIALFKAKELGKNRHVYFDPKMLDEALYLIELNKDMSTGLENEEYELYYQPQVDIKTNKIVGAEALIRWNKDGKQISPVEFIPVAEKTGFIVELGWWIITDALKEKLIWETKGLDLTISINIAAKQFADENFYDNFKFYVNKFKVNPNEIILEITEYIFLYGEEVLMETFNNLKSMGVSISLDDFGTGYSSLSYIKHFPIDTIKIDKSFIDDYKSEAGAVFLETIISMSINLEIDLVAEGVEEEDQLDFLSKRHCKKYQGYLCSKPVPSKAFQKLYLDSLK